MSSDDLDDSQERRPQFGTRFLLDKKNVFEHNAWDNVVWDDVQEAAAKSKVEDNSEIVLTSEEIEKLDQDAAAHWDAFYDIHQNKFFKDRNWLFTEFPELAHSSPPWKNGKISPSTSKTVEKDVLVKQSDNQGETGDKRESERTSVSCEGEKYPSSDSEVNQRVGDVTGVSSGDTFPGEKAEFRVLEVGCGVGNTIFPILKTNNAEDLFVYGCDFSSHAVDIVKASTDYEEKRFGQIVANMAAYLRPGGLILFRDYGRYDLAQLRFKKGRCLSENFYARGDGTRCYFFTQEEVRQLMTSVGLEEVQNLVDRRLQVNRGKKLTMYRVWVQAKYRKPLTSTSS